MAAIVADHRAKGTDPADAIEHYRTWTRQAMERAVDFGVEWVELVRGRP